MLNPDEAPASLDGITPTMQRALVRLLRGPMIPQRFGWARADETMDGVTSHTIEALRQRGLVRMHFRGGRMVRARKATITARGDHVARTVGWRALEAAVRRAVERSREEAAHA